MTHDVAELHLAPAVVTGTFLDGDLTRRPESHFLDLVVDGRSLRSITAGAGPDLVTELNRAWLPDVPQALNRLLGRRPSEGLAPGRIPLLLCHVDGDLACGALTTTLRVAGSEVSWSDFLWEDGLHDPSPVDRLDRPLTFDRDRYEAAFAGAYARVADFPYDEMAHHGRRLLWPWQWGWGLPRG